MRRVFMLLIVFSLLLSSCQPEDNLVSQPFSTRHESGFSEWSIPGYFIPKKIHVIGLGDSLTQGVGDELKKSGYFGRVTDKMKEWKGVLDVDSANLAKRGRRSDQLIKQLEESEIQSAVEEADLIYLTIGGNDIMKVVKANLFNLKVEPFYRELGDFENRLDELFTIIRTLNGDAIIIVGGLYNPISIVTDEANEFDEILEDWNEAIEIRAIMDGKACFVPVTDLFDSNVNMVYHTDFFHPNAKGYDGMANRFLESIQKCGLLELSEGQLDM